MIEIDAQGLNAREFADILCDRCGNAPFAYYCPACDFKVCGDCVHRAFRKKRDGSLVCKRCSHTDRSLDTFIGPDKP